jgi:hypothetical protein
MTCAIASLTHIQKAMRILGRNRPTICEPVYSAGIGGMGRTVRTTGFSTRVPRVGLFLPRKKITKENDMPKKNKRIGNALRFLPRPSLQKQTATVVRPLKTNSNKQTFNIVSSPIGAPIPGVSRKKAKRRP